MCVYASSVGIDFFFNMLPTIQSRSFYALLLLALAWRGPTILMMIEAQSIKRFEELPTNLQGQCTISSLTKYYNDFESAKVANLTFDPVKGWSIIMREICDPTNNAVGCKDSTYNLEGVRSIPPSIPCTYCPYHLDPFADIISQYDTSANWVELYPMFGPCLNNQKSKRMVCMQHHALAPQKFLGKYFYPLQKALSIDVMESFYDTLDPYPIHQFLLDQATSSPFVFGQNNRNPTEYGLGESAVKMWLNNLVFQFKNGTIDTLTTDAMQRPYTKINNVEQWMKYAQYFCTPGCHKNNRLAFFTIRAEDIAGDPELAYLSYYIQDSDTPTACRPCPQYTASYIWLPYDEPAHPKLNFMADQCYPWFGAIPSMIPSLTSNAYRMNITKISRASETNPKINYPVADDEVYPLVCPVNTYNRICAHTKASIYSNAKVLSNAQMLKDYECTPCPAGGYHTGGRVGQWYCSPPPGRLLVNRLQIQANPDIWGDRDYMTFYFPELECGPNPSDCKQCPDAAASIGLTPAAYNELFIFSKLLSEVDCAGNFYCPDAFTSIPCPAERPWSPPGSSLLSNCTCSKGKFLINATTCVPCTASCQDKPGFYLPRSQCLDKNGATKDAPCLRCTNLPPERATADGSGQELSPGVGACPYHCNFGSEMDQSAFDKTLYQCQQRYTCKLPAIRKNKLDHYVYRNFVSTDTDKLIFINEKTCALKTTFSDLLSKIDDSAGGGWLEQPTSCISQCLGQNKICYAENQTAPLVDPTNPWYSFSAVMNCVPCPNLKDISSSNVYLLDNNNDNVHQGAQFCKSPQLFCNTTHYFNQTAWECQSCAARESLICPSMTRLRAAGCLGRFDSFNLSSPASDCQKCTLATPEFGNSLYLNYQSNKPDAVGGCSLDACKSLPTNFFWAQPCGGDRAGEQRACSMECPYYQFRKAPCTTNADLVCQDCTTIKVGYRKTNNCSVASDSEWELCPEGYYCDASGMVQQCPINRTSLIGANSISKCFCKVGLQEGQNGGDCIPFQCPGTFLSPNLPGSSLNSSFYMTLDQTTRASTTCLPCNTVDQGSIKAYTRGDGLEVASCVCPSGYYGVFPNASKLSIQCTQCPSSPTCKTGRNLPVSCAQGDVKLLPNDNFPCACTATPFTVTSTTTTSLSPCTAAVSCATGFTAISLPSVARTPVQGYPQVSGSSTYTLGTWKRFVATSIFSNIDNNIRSFSVSGCMDDSVLGNGEAAQSSPQTYHYEYVFWIVYAAAAPKVYTALLRGDEMDIANNKILFWDVEPSNSFQSAMDIPKLIGIAVSKWGIINPALQYKIENRKPWIYVGVLMRKFEEEQGLFYMKVGVFNSTNDPNTLGRWESLAYNITLFPPSYATSNAIPVAVAHGNKRLGEATATTVEGFFYTAFNTLSLPTNPPSTQTTAMKRCGGIIVSHPMGLTPSTIFNSFCATDNSAITAMVITQSLTSLQTMALISLESGQVLRLENPNMADLSPFFQTIPSAPPSIAFNNMMILFSQINPVYVTGIHSETLCTTSDGFNCIKAADASEMAWVDIQGMPWGTALNSLSTLGNMAASVTDRSNALLVVSRGTSLFTLAIQRCFGSSTSPSSSQYWDGVGCAAHSCVKQMSCDQTMKLVDGICICKQGFFASVPNPTICQPCQTPNYCENGKSTQCPDGTVTLQNSASSINECICQSPGQFFSKGVASTIKCVNCLTSDSWCPNQWLNIQCPGVFKNPPTVIDNIATSPVQCTCAAGYTGPNCAPCPDGFYCPDGQTSTASNLAAYYIFAQTPLATLVAEYITTFFTTYFSQGPTKPPNFNSNNLDKFLFTQVIPATNKTSFGIIVMIQIDGLPADANSFKGWPQSLYDYLNTKRANVTSKLPATSTPYTYSVKVNKPLQCMTSKVPSVSPSSTCVCAPGYETKGEQCSACPVHTYKVSAGPGACIACPIGKVAPIRSTTPCIPDPSLLTNQGDGTSGGPDTTLLVGGIGGGIFGLIILLALMQHFFKQSKK